MVKPGEQMARAAYQNAGVMGAVDATPVTPGIQDGWALAALREKYSPLNFKTPLPMEVAVDLWRLLDAVEALVGVGRGESAS